MVRLAAAGFLLSLFLACARQQAWAGWFDPGLGLGFVDSTASSDFEGGFDVIAGYEKDLSDRWNTGAHTHFIKGWTDKNRAVSDSGTYFQSTALYATVRPDNWWLQFSGGAVSADYKSLTMEGGGTGIAVGGGIVLGGENLRLHVLDYHRYIVGGQGFDIYSIGIALLRY